MSASADKPPALAIKEALEAMQMTLETLVAQQKQYGDLGLLLADCRDSMTDAVGVMQSQGSAILQRFDQAHHQQHRQEPSWLAWAGGGLIGALLVGLTWTWTPPRASRYERLLGAVDAVLVQHYGAFPKPIQDQLSAAYARAGVQGPGQRQAKGGPR